MTNIDPSRLTAIFRALSATETYKSQSAEGNLDKKKTSLSKSISIEDGSKRNKEKLKQALSLRLKILKKEDPEFQKKAPLVAIKEILLWEFGEELINHPDFNYISQIVTEQVDTNKSLHDYMKKLITTYTN